MFLTFHGKQFSLILATNIDYLCIAITGFLRLFTVSRILEISKKTFFWVSNLKKLTFQRKHDSTNENNQYDYGHFNELLQKEEIKSPLSVFQFK